MPTFLNRLLCLTGAGLILAGLTLPWFEVPFGFAGGTGNEVKWSDSPVTPWLKLGSVLLLLAGILASARRFEARRRWVASSCVGVLMIASWLPYLTMTRCVVVSRQATWLEMQHRNLTWLGGDIYNGMEYRFMPNKSKVFAVDTPRVLRALPLLDKSFTDIGLADVADVFQWLGMTPAFTEFVSRGWFLTLAGALIALCGSLARPGESGLIDLSILNRLVFYGGVQVIVALGVVAASGTCLRQAREALDQGKYVEADTCLLRAQQVLPIHSFDSDIVLQRGLCQHAAGLDTPNATLYVASRLERGGFRHRANALFEKLARMDVRSSRDYCQFEAHRALLRQAINGLNSGNVVKAAQTLDYLRAVYPANLKVLYTRQLAAIRLYETETLKSLHRDLLGIYDYLQSPNKRAVIAASHEHLLQAAILSNDVDGMVSHRQGMVRGR